MEQPHTIKFNNISIIILHPTYEPTSVPAIINSVYFTQSTIVRPIAINSLFLLLNFYPGVLSVLKSGTKRIQLEDRSPQTAVSQTLDARKCSATAEKL